MMLIGMFDSPFVRRVAVSMKLQGLAFEHANWSVGRDFERIRQYNPLGRVPTLVLDDGEVLLESAAILDYVDDLVGPQRALLPASGRERRDALRLMSMAVGAAEKGREQIYEYAFRPAEKRHQPWLDRTSAQMYGALMELERHCASRPDGSWAVGDRMTQADITLCCAYTFLSEAFAVAFAANPYPCLQALVARCEALPAFQNTRVAFVAPSNASAS